MNILVVSLAFVISSHADSFHKKGLIISRENYLIFLAMLSNFPPSFIHNSTFFLCLNSAGYKFSNKFHEENNKEITNECGRERNKNST